MYRYTESYYQFLQKLYAHFLPGSPILPSLDHLLPRIEVFDARENCAADQVFGPVSATVMAL